MIRSRRSAREIVLKALYAIEMAGSSPNQVLADPLLVKENAGALFEFSKALLTMTVKNRVEFDTYIRKKAHNWDFDRLAIIDKLVLRMALCEFLYFDDIPPKVSIDEAIEITRKYSTEKSDKFVNGILDGILNDLRQNGKINKKGRGLLEQSHPDT